MDRPTQSASAPTLGLSPGARTVASLLLFLHLFCIVVGMTSNQVASLLEDGLRRQVPGLRAYLQTLLLDFSYAFTYTYTPSDAPDADTQCWVDFELTMPDGSTRNEVVPPENIRSRLRSRRYERLAFQSVNWAFAQHQVLESAFPRTLARALVNETGATGGKLSVRWRQRGPIGNDPFVPPAPQVRTAYEARILVDPDNRSQVDLFKIESAAEVAPKAEK
ncbi:MAG: hypothetical protein JSS27_06390 [Planctomycetes bacterium]|nr:hypothetical protein [Planctomycetota bacterium]